MLLPLVLLAPLAEKDGCRHFTDQQRFCYHFCREQLQGRATPDLGDATDFSIESKGSESYCRCAVKVQLPTKLKPERQR